MNSTLEPMVTYQLIELLKEFKDVFTYTYKDLKGIASNIAQHMIKLDTMVPPVHQARYRLNPNYCYKYYSFLIPNVDECVKHSSKG